MKFLRAVESVCFKYYAYLLAVGIIKSIASQFIFQDERSNYIFVLLFIVDRLF